MDKKYNTFELTLLNNVTKVNVFLKYIVYTIYLAFLTFFYGYVIIVLSQIEKDYA